MFRIGDFSRLARVSARLLRFYDEIGLFEPAHADAQSGYRYYTVGQLAALNRITVLKELGFNLEQVRDILRAPVDAAELRSMLMLRRHDVERTLAVETQRLRRIETRIAQIESDGVMTADDVVVRPEPAHRWLSMRCTVASFSEARAAIAAFRERVRPVLPERHAGQWVVVTHSLQFEADELDLEIGLTVDDITPERLGGAQGLQLGELSAVERMAVCVRAGPPEEAHLVTARVGMYLERSGDALAGPGREAFLHLPDPDRMSEAVVEMQFPVRPR